MRPNTSDTVDTTVRSMKILQHLQEAGPTRLSDISSALDMSPSTVHRHLETLCNLRYVSRSGNNYQLGLRFVRLGHAAKTREESFRQAKDHVEELAAETGERAQFVVEDHGLGVFLHIATGEKAIRTGIASGRQIHLHSSGVGKSILSQYPRERVDEIIDRWGLPKQTEQTVTDRDELYDELDRIKERGVSFNREEHIKGVTAASVPVKNAEEEIIGALSVAGPSHRMKGKRIEETIPDLLLGAANALELELTYDEQSASDTFAVE